MKERFGAKRAESMKLRTHAQTAGVSLTAQQPYNNVVRVALQALAAVLGGTQSLHTNSLDETYALPTEEAVMIALRTQQIIAEESGVANTIDPLGGSCFVEELTNRLETEAARLHPAHRRDGRDGRAPSRRGTRSARSPRARTASSGSSRRTSGSWSASTSYEVEKGAPIPLLKIDETVQRQQVENLRAREGVERDAARRAAAPGRRARGRDARRRT